MRYREVFSMRGEVTWPVVIVWTALAVAWVMLLMVVTR